MTTPNKRLLGIIIAVGVLLLIPFVATKLGTGANWSAFDFIAAGVLLLGTGLAIEVALRLITKWEYRIAACAGILAILALLWIEIAVGLFGSPIAGS
ncbi:MAG: hypothetical protein ABL984_11165 [Pyrinomonadaceae bacterium]